MGMGEGPDRGNVPEGLESPPRPHERPSWELPPRDERRTWNEPVTSMGPGDPHWLLQLAPWWGRLVELVYEDLDGLSLQHWDAVRRRFDQGMDPGSPAEANERWREGVVGVWTLKEKRQERERQAMNARQRRRP